MAKYHLVRRRKRHVGRPRKRHFRKRRVYGRGIWDDIKNAAGNVNNWLKSSKVISTLGAPLASLLPAPYQGIANGAVNFAKANGYGRKRKRRVVKRRTVRKRVYGRGIAYVHRGTRVKLAF